MAKRGGPEENVPKRTVVQIKDFAGLQSGISPHDVEPGGTVTQTNMQSITPGEINTRSGIREVTFDVQ